MSLSAAIADLYEYGNWANGKLLALARDLPEAQLRQRFSQGALPILESFCHLVSADRRWLVRFQEAPLPAGLTVAELPTMAAVERAYAEVASARRAYLATLDDVAVGAMIRWADGAETRELVRWQALVQSANHGTQHRSEIAAMLTDCGRSPGDLDFGLWCRQHARGGAPAPAR
jgi:uncharacterized damage-inducible protein DinB